MMVLLVLDSSDEFEAKLKLAGGHKSRGSLNLSATATFTGSKDHRSAKVAWISIINTLENAAHVVLLLNVLVSEVLDGRAAPSL